ncbi:hypothetical protein WKI71_09350 [Streptomyces sp. MS1.AVA.1]|uniref:NACHT domain-containing protein n=1 Tax=Streptomyces machairae TaxID=3134109 RepID=A0ABU8UID7_9ACTN
MADLRNSSSGERSCPKVARTARRDRLSGPVRRGHTGGTADRPACRGPGGRGRGAAADGAGAYLAWSAYRADRAEAASAATDPAVVADRLAVAVRRQWEAEARARRLADPYPLPVSWRGADADLAEVTAGPAGRDGEIGAVFTDRVPDRRLLVLGAPGSGKTMLLVRLLLALIEDRTAGDPVPVLFPLASWDPTAVDLRAWMERKLVQDHAELGAAAPGSTGRRPSPGCCWSGVGCCRCWTGSTNCPRIWAGWRCT